MTAPGCSDDEAPEGYASPPCLMHELDPVYLGLAAEADPQQRRDVMRWRKATRERLLAARQAVRFRDLPWPRRPDRNGPRGRIGRCQGPARLMLLADPR